MNPIVRCSIPSRNDPLGIGLKPSANTSLTIEPHISVGGPFSILLAVYDDTDQTVKSGLEQTAAVTVECLEEGSENPSRQLYGIEWHATSTGIFACVRQSDATLLSGSYRSGQWEFELQFFSKSFSEFSNACRTQNLELTIQSITHNPLNADGQGGGQLQRLLTEKQHEAIVRATAMGYFEIPRQISTGDLADQFGISDTALSQRLRRGTSRIVRDATTEKDYSDGSTGF